MLRFTCRAGSANWTLTDLCFNLLPFHCDLSQSVYDFYHFSAKVGHTQNGVIYLGCDKKSQGDVAIHAEDKRNLPLHKMLILTKRDLSVVSATQSHECVVRVIDLFESTKRFYTVTELVSGGTLHDLLSRPLSETVARDVMADILHGLQHLHLHDVVHGNLDALHIMCSKRSLPCLVKIVAYGNAVARRDARLLGGTTSGFWQTLAPEVVCFQRRSAASDVFSAGSLLFRMLCGISPFATDHEAAYLACVSRGLAFEGKVWDGISEEARALVRNMLSDDASSRPTATQCLDCEWFRGGLADADGADLEDGLVRVASDPKTVIMDFEMARPMSRGPVGGAIRGSSANELEDLSYGKLEA